MAAVVRLMKASDASLGWNSGGGSFEWPEEGVRVTVHAVSAGLGLCQRLRHFIAHAGRNLP